LREGLRNLTGCGAHGCHYGVRAARPSG
jgi:hypothetical protein